jgi:two-component system, NarL family, response regulator DevR
MAPSASVAIVDDEPKLVRTYELLLKRRHIPISFLACDADDAIEKFRTADTPPGVVIIDYRLPSGSGIDVLRAIKAEGPGTKIIFISGDEDARKESLAAGADLFLKKPARIMDITDSINALLSG